MVERVYILFILLRFLAFLLLPPHPAYRQPSPHHIYIWLRSSAGDSQPSVCDGGASQRHEKEMFWQLALSNSVLRFLHRPARQTIRLRLRLCKSFSLPTWLMFYFKVEQQQTSPHKAAAFWIACHSSLACLAFYTSATNRRRNGEMFSDSVITQAFFLVCLFVWKTSRLWFDSNWFEAFA